MAVVSPREASRKARRRPTVEIAASILKRTSAEPLGISKIILVENISYKEAKKCLDQLLHSGLIKFVENDGSKRYITTQKGLDFIFAVRSVIDTYAGNKQNSRSKR